MKKKNTAFELNLVDALDIPFFGGPFSKIALNNGNLSVSIKDISTKLKIIQ
jgi:hypothetical protein